MEVMISKEIYDKLDHAKKIAPLDPKKSIEISRDVYKLAKNNGLKLEEGYAFLNIAFASRIKSDTSSILENAYEALSIFKNKNDIIGQSKALNLIGIAYFYSSMYDEALKCFFDGRKLLDLHNDDTLLASILNNIGEVYKDSEIYDKAIEYYNMGTNVISKNGNHVYHAVILGNIGEIYFIKKEFKMALEVYNKSYTMLLDADEVIFLPEVENKIGKLYFQIEDFINAEKYYLKAFKRLRNIDNKYYSIDVLINLAQLYEVKSFSGTLNLYEKAMYYAEGIGAKKKLFNIYNLISQYHEKQKDYKNALLYYKKYFNINEELKSLNLKDKLEVLNIDLRKIQDKDKIDNIRIRLEKEIKRQKDELENIKSSNEILEKKAYEDELTEIANRRSINIYIENILNDISLKQDKIVLFMIDIDKFKRYNDFWGHTEGDICLKKIANCIKKIQVNNKDIFGRYGGEEFIYISTSISYKQALQLGNFIRTEVEKIGLYYMDKGKKKCTTISMGGVIGNVRDFSSIREIIQYADKELYIAKSMGRNITIIKDIDIKG